MSINFSILHAAFCVCITTEYNYIRQNQQNIYFSRKIIINLRIKKSWNGTVWQFDVALSEKHSQFWFWSTHFQLNSLFYAFLLFLVFVSFVSSSHIAIQHLSIAWLISTTNFFFSIWFLCSLSINLHSNCINPTNTWISAKNLTNKKTLLHSMAYISCISLLKLYRYFHSTEWTININ